MERSGSQKALKVLGIIYIIIGVIGIIAGVFTMIGGGLGTSALVATTDLEVSGAGIIGLGLLIFFGIMSLISGIISLICGIFANRAANDCHKWRGLFVITVISLVLNVINLISAIASHQSIVAAIISVVWSILILWLANNVRKLSLEG